MLTFWEIHFPTNGGRQECFNLVNEEQLELFWIQWSIFPSSWKWNEGNCASLPNMFLNGWTIFTIQNQWKFGLNVQAQMWRNCLIPNPSDEINFPFFNLVRKFSPHHISFGAGLSCFTYTTTIYSQGITAMADNSSSKSCVSQRMKPVTALARWCRLQLLPGDAVYNSRQVMPFTNLARWCRFRFSPNDELQLQSRWSCLLFRWRSC